MRSVPLSLSGGLTVGRKLLTSVRIVVVFPFLWVHDLVGAARDGLRHSGRLTVRSLGRILREVWAPTPPRPLAARTPAVTTRSERRHRDG